MTGFSQRYFIEQCKCPNCGRTNTRALEEINQIKSHADKLLWETLGAREELMHRDEKAVKYAKRAMIFAVISVFFAVISLIGRILIWRNT